jgi:hypothetical protein
MMTERKIRIEYDGSKGWLLFWGIVFFPVALVLLVTSGKFTLDQHVYYVRYDGSRFWLGFWVIFLFPVAFALLLLNGLTLVTEDRSTPVPV